MWIFFTNGCFALVVDGCVVMVFFVAWGGVEGRLWDGLFFVVIGGKRRGGGRNLLVHVAPFFRK